MSRMNNKYFTTNPYRMLKKCPSDWTSFGTYIRFQLNIASFVDHLVSRIIQSVFVTFAAALPTTEPNGSEHRVDSTRSEVPVILQTM